MDKTPRLARNPTVTLAAAKTYVIGFSTTYFARDRWKRPRVGAQSRPGRVSAAVARSREKIMKISLAGVSR